MSRRTDALMEIGINENRHYNCCQKVFISFNDVCNIDRESAYSLGLHFGGGMRVGSICGAVTGAVMTMGMTGCSDVDVKRFISDFEDKHGDIYCNKLLLNVSEDLPRSALCNGLICDAILSVEDVLCEG